MEKLIYTETAKLEEAINVLISRNVETLTNLALIHQVESDLIVQLCQALSVLLVEFDVQQRKGVLESCVKDILEGAEFYARAKAKKDHH